ncbi:MAG: glycosyltransferase family 1 protein [Candidatus Omnitrophica bacterium]|nr:glycosyltransferase family 1 protein [Candidatus Omnitrophota bacterium]
MATGFGVCLCLSFGTGHLLIRSLWNLGGNVADILLISTDHSPMRGGIARVIEHFCRSFEKGKLVVLACDHSEAKKESNVIRLTVDLNASWLGKTAQLLIWLLESVSQIRRYSIPLVVISTLSPMGILGPILKYFFGKPYCIFAYASEIPMRNSFFFRRWLARIIYESSSRVLCISEYALARVLAVAPNARCAITTLGVDCSRFKIKARNKNLIKRYGLEGRRVFLCLGRLVRRKGYDRAIESFAKAFAGRNDVMLLIAGDGPDRESLSALAINLGVGSIVRFAGALEEHELVDVYNLAEVFLFLAREEKGDAEGFGLVILEAAACGCVVIGGRSGAIPEVIQDGGTGVLVDPENVDEIASKMSELIQNDELRKNLSEQGRAYALSQTWNRTGETIRQIFETVSSGGARARG